MVQGESPCWLLPKAVGFVELDDVLATKRAGYYDGIERLLPTNDLVA